MAREKVSKGLEAAKRLERHLEGIATELATKDTMTHIVNAGMEIVQAANAAVSEMDVPKETKVRIHKAEKELLLAIKSSIEVILAEIDKETAASRSELRKIEIKRPKHKAK